MKRRIFSIIGLFAILISLRCSKNEMDDYIIIDPTNIDFVYEDGSIIENKNCIDPSRKYAVQIQTESAGGKGVYKVTKMDYTVNGVLHSMTFSEIGSQRNPVALLEGENKAQIVETSITSTIYFTPQNDFELVE